MTYKKSFLAMPAVFVSISGKRVGFGYAYTHKGKDIALEVLSGTNDGAVVYIPNDNTTYSDADFAALKPKTVDIELAWDDAWIRLNDGTAMLRDYGKYRSGLLILNEVPELRWTQVGYQSKYFVEGDFFTTRKGAPAFRIKDGGKHRLWKKEWNGYANIPDGDVANALYNHIAKSNKGGAGVQYWVA